MPYSLVYYTATGTIDEFNVPFPYLSKTHVEVAVNGGVTTNWTWVTDDRIRLSETPAANDVVRIARKSSRNARLVNYETPSSLNEEDLDTDSLQAFYLAQEAMDAAAATVGDDVATGQFTVDGRRITNLSDPIDPQDAATRAFVLARIGQGPVPNGDAGDAGPAVLSADATVVVPTDFPTLQAALDAYAGVRPTQTFRVRIVIASGHRLTRGVHLEGGDYSHVVISSADPVVYLDDEFEGATYGQSSHSDRADYMHGGGWYAETVEDCLFLFRSCVAPHIDALFDMEQRFGSGVVAIAGSVVNTYSGKGVRNAGWIGLHTSASRAYAYRAIFSGAKGAAARLTQQSLVGLQEANLSGSLTEHSQGASVFVSRGSMVHITDADISNSKGHAVACHRSFLSATGTVVDDAEGMGFYIRLGSHATLQGASIRNCGNYPIYCDNGSIVEARGVDMTGGRASSGGDQSIRIRDGGRVTANGCVWTTSTFSNIPVNTFTSEGYVLDDAQPTPPAGVTDLHGLGSTSLSQPPSNDLDLVVRTGFHRSTSATLNSPHPNASVLTMVRDAGRASQVAVSSFEGPARMWMRSQTTPDGVWTDWTEVGSGGGESPFQPGDVTAQFTAAVADVATYGGDLILPAGTFDISGNLVQLGASKPFRIIGAGKGATVLRRIGTPGTTAFLNFEDCDGVEIMDLTVDAQLSVLGDGSHAIRLSRCPNSAVRRVHVRDYRDTGVIHFDDQDDTTFWAGITVEDVSIDGMSQAQNGILLSNAERSLIRDCEVRNLRMDGDPSFGLQFKNKVRDSRIVGGLVDGGRAGIAMGSSVTPSPNITNCRVKDVIIRGCTRGVKIGFSEFVDINGVQIDMSDAADTWPVGHANDAPENAVYLNFCNNVAITGLTLTGYAYSDYPVLIRQSAGCTIEFDRYRNVPQHNKFVHFDAGASGCSVVVKNWVGFRFDFMEDVATYTTDQANTFDVLDDVMAARMTVSLGRIQVFNRALKRIRLDTQGAASSDTLDSIEGPGVHDGMTLLLSTTNDSRDIALSHVNGNITLSTTLSDRKRVIQLAYNETLPGWAFV